MPARGFKYYTSFVPSIGTIQCSSGVIREENMLVILIYIFICPSNMFLFVCHVQDGFDDVFNTSCHNFKNPTPNASRQKRQPHCDQIGQYLCYRGLFSLVYLFSECHAEIDISCSFILRWFGYGCFYIWLQCSYMPPKLSRKFTKYKPCARPEKIPVFSVSDIV